jgi:hypothetical protein
MPCFLRKTRHSQGFVIVLHPQTRVYRCMTRTTCCHQT